MSASLQQQPRSGLLTSNLESPPLIRLRGLGVDFDSRQGPITAFRDVDLDICRGEFLVIVGPSGCGKTTLLKVLAELQTQTRGKITYPGNGEIAPSNALVFQGRSVFPWMSVEDNIGYGLRAQGISGKERAATVDQLLAVTGLTRFKNAWPHELSEGMRQRVAIARALAVDPDLLLMDEPFGALDEQTRYLLQEELLRIWDSSGKTVVFVTHSIDEALTLADRIVIMTAHPGTIKQEILVPFPRPREVTEVRSNPAFADLFTSIWGSLRDEVNATRAMVEGTG